MGAQPGAANLAEELVAAVPAHVAGEVVGGAPESRVLRNRGHEMPRGRDRSTKLAERGFVSLDVLQHVEDPNRVEAGGERDFERAHLHERDARQTPTRHLEAFGVGLRPMT